MKLASAILTAIGGSEIAWYWYSASVLTISQSLAVIAIFAFAVLFAVIGWGTEV